MRQSSRALDILLVEDNPGDVRLTVEALKECHVNSRLAVARDGVEALDFLYHRGLFHDAPCPDIILLDLNLPRKDGKEVLATIKSDSVLRRIPVIVLTTSNAEDDILTCYDLHANGYITKPLDMDQFVKVIQAIDHFWFTCVQLPKRRTPPIV